jgi:4-aminobutyrate---pyruvate transaminase
MHGFTYGGHPVACATALANLAIFDREDLLGQAREKGRILQEKLQPLKQLRPVGDIRGIGLLAVIDLAKDKDSKEKFSPPSWAEREVLKEALARGLICRVTFNGLALAPPLIITEEEIDRAVSIMAEAIEAATPRIMPA